MPKARQAFDSIFCRSIMNIPHPVISLWAGPQSLFVASKQDNGMMERGGSQSAANSLPDLSFLGGLDLSTVWICQILTLAGHSFIDFLSFCLFCSSLSSLPLTNFHPLPNIYCPRAPYIYPYCTAVTLTQMTIAGWMVRPKSVIVGPLWPEQKLQAHCVSILIQGVFFSHWYPP